MATVMAQMSVTLDTKGGIVYRSRLKGRSHTPRSMRIVCVLATGIEASISTTPIAPDQLELLNNQLRTTGTSMNSSTTTPTTR